MANVMCGKRNLERGYTANLKGPMGLLQKLRLIAGNTSTKIRKLQTCCGNYNQPGC